jgi:hypothetical protein
LEKIEAIEQAARFDKKIFNLRCFMIRGWNFNLGMQENEKRME